LLTAFAARQPDEIKEAIVAMTIASLIFEPGKVE
jgi:hypothetical protein